MIRKLLSTFPGCWVLAALASITLAAPARAQVRAVVHPGDLVRLRLDHDSRPRTGRLIRIDQDSIVLARKEQGGAVIAVQRAAVAEAWVSRGRSRSTLRGLVIGLGAGVVGGALLGAISYKPCQNCLIDLGRGASTLAGAVVGGALGLVTGTVIGFATHREKWQPVQVPVRVSAGGRGGLAVAVRLRL